MKKLHPLFLGCFATMLLVLSSCEVKDNTPCTARYTYHPLTDEEKSKSPYFNNPDFDTLRFLSNAGDTLTFALQSTDSSWYIEDANRNPNPDGCPDWQYYETKTRKFKNITSSSLLNITLSKKNTLYPLTSIVIQFDKYSFLFNVSLIGVSSSVYYVGELSMLNNNYEDVQFVYHNSSPESNIKGYLNSIQGFVGLDDKNSNLKFALIR